MYQKMKKQILAIVPARGGSKGIPQKNIRKLGGTPLIGITLRELSKVDKDLNVLVSTDDPAIAEIAARFGCPVQELRPPDLAQDDTAMIDVVIDAIEKNNCNYVLLLQPTSPFRTSEHINKFLTYCIDKDLESAVSISKVSKHPSLMYKMSASGLISPFVEGIKATARRQDLEDIHALDGALYWASTEHLYKFKRFISDSTHGFELSSYIPIDLDTEKDWQLAEAVIKLNI